MTTKFLLIFTCLLFLISLSFQKTFIVNADTACGVGSVCTGSTTYLKVTSCMIAPAHRNYPSTINPAPNCINTDAINTDHFCPTGGGANSCRAIAPGRIGCTGKQAYYISGILSCSTGGPCSEVGTQCGVAPYFGTCLQITPGEWSCDGILPDDGPPLGCCYTGPACGNDICDPGETCGSCPQDCSCTPPPPQFCGNGSCRTDLGESCSNCSQDCGQCPETCGNGSCNTGAGETPANCPLDCGGEVCGNGSCNAGSGENCNNCQADCGVCTGCGDGVCSVGENSTNCPADCPACGDGICDASTESCSTCSADCGTCVVEFCGNGTCSAFESCSTCSSDCGVCPAEISWWQSQGGNVYAARQSSPAITSIVPGLTCSEPTCAPYLLAELQASLLPNTDGVIITGGGSVQADGYYTPRNLVALGSRLTRYKEGYDFFYRKSGLSLVPTDAFTSSYTSATKPATAGIHYSNQDLTIQEPWTISSTESYVIFVNGNLTIQDPTDAGALITVDEGGFLAFIVRGDILIDASVGHANPATATPNLEGVYIADQTIQVLSDSNAATSDRRFIGAGSFIGWTGVTLQRDFDDGGSGSSTSLTTPSELFIYRPDLLFTAPAFMLSPHSIWQETN